MGRGLAADEQRGAHVGGEGRDVRSQMIEVFTDCVDVETPRQPTARLPMKVHEQKCPEASVGYPCRERITNVLP